MKKFFLLGLILGTSACVSLYAAGIHSVVKSQVKDLDKKVLEKKGTGTGIYDGDYEYTKTIYWTDIPPSIGTPWYLKFKVSNGTIISTVSASVHPFLDGGTVNSTGVYSGTVVGGNFEILTVSGKFSLTNEFTLTSSVASDPNYNPGMYYTFTCRKR